MSTSEMQKPMGSSKRYKKMQEVRSKKHGKSKKSTSQEKKRNKPKKKTINPSLPSPSSWEVRLELLHQHPSSSA